MRKSGGMHLGLPEMEIVEALRNYPVLLFGCLPADAVEVPPFTGKRAETGFFHHLAQESAVLQFVYGELAGSYQLFFFGDVCLLAKIIYGSTHWKWLPLCIDNADVYSHTVVVQATAARRIGYVYILGSSFYDVPHFLLDRHRARCVIDNKTVTGAYFFQSFLGLQQAFQCFRMKIGFVQVFIQHLSCEVVCTSVHQIYANTAVCFGNIN